MVNKVIIVGYLGADPEMRYTQEGSPIARFNVATSEQWKDRNGEKQQRTEWHRVSAFGRLAEICGQYLSKGSLVYLEGKLQTRSWDDKDGIKRYTTEIITDTIRMLDRKGQGQTSESHSSGSSSNQFGDDIPF